MTMVAKDSPRRLYTRSAHGLVLCFGGEYFGPKANEVTKLTKDDQVTVEILAKAGGKSRIKVTQVVEGEGKRAITEVWTQKELHFEKRKPAQQQRAA